MSLLSITVQTNQSHELNNSKTAILCPVPIKAIALARNSDSSTTEQSTPLPSALQGSVDQEERDREVFEDSWTRTRPGEKKEQKQIAQAEASEPLPPELEKMVDDEEAEEDLFEDSWTRTRPGDKWGETKGEVDMTTLSKGDHEAVPVGGRR